MMILINIVKIFRRYYRDYRKSKNTRIKLFNYQIHNFKNFTHSNSSIESHWIVRYIKKLDLLPSDHSTLSIFGVNGDKLAIKLNHSKYRIFYTIENVHVTLSPWKKYEDLMLEDKRIDLSIGFDYINHAKYVRLPFWIMTSFNPEDNLKQIVDKCLDLENVKTILYEKMKFCAFICREDYFGDRSFFADEISSIENIHYPGKFRHNDNELIDIFKDDKIEYLKQFKFNLCPENSNNSGYVTEKLLDAIRSGCIPIYWGSDNHPEPNILNQERILFLRLREDNSATIRRIEVLNSNPSEYYKFVRQPIFLPGAPALIYDHYLQLNKKLIEVIK